jgi:hypothetical protein
VGLWADLNGAENFAPHRDSIPGPIIIIIIIIIIISRCTHCVHGLATGLAGTKTAVSAPWFREPLWGPTNILSNGYPWFFPLM